MNIETGHGFLALKAQRLSVVTGTEALGATVISASLNYGGAGTCRSGTLSVIDAPPGWLSGLYTPARDLATGLRTRSH